MISWSETLATGIARIDEEHQKLVAMLNALEEAIQVGRGSKVVATIVADLGLYADRHFSHEETCMEQYRCPTAAENKQAHAHFREMLAKAQTRLNGGGNALAAQQVHRELCEWVVKHVLRVDSALRGCKRAVA